MSPPPMRPKEVLQLCSRAATRGTRTFMLKNAHACMLLALGLAFLARVSAISTLTLLWFLILGVSSSIGFGVGVPTRILFLIPYTLQNASMPLFRKLCTCISRLLCACNRICRRRTASLPQQRSPDKILWPGRWRFKIGTLPSMGDEKDGRIDSRALSFLPPGRMQPLMPLASRPARRTWEQPFLLATMIGKACIRAPLTCAIVLMHSILRIHCLDVCRCKKKAQRPSAPYGQRRYSLLQCTHLQSQ